VLALLSAHDAFLNWK